MRMLWIASRNSGKLRELERLLGPLGLRLRSQGEAPGSVVVEEDQPTFAGNARKKAAALARAIAAPAMADDSGLCVDALGGRPGVNSARWAGPEAADQDRIQKLLDEMRSVPEGNRTAHFTCAICLVDPDGRALLEIEEQCPGAILMEPRGEGGFGYDPVFVATQHLDQPRPRSFAELSAKDKDAVSHRGKALRRLLTQLAGNLEHIPTERP
jgi:XTP/dITP diphosphohydrolase